jgi:hypothetical protein
MNLQSDEELQNTIEKLARLEKHYVKAKQRPEKNAYAHALSLRSLKRMINQLKEEIVRYRAGVHTRPQQERGIRTDQQLENKRRKLRELEECLARCIEEPTENEDVKALSARSLKQAMKQLKEEIARYLAKAKVPVKQ